MEKKRYNKLMMHYVVSIKYKTYTVTSLFALFFNLSPLSAALAATVAPTFAGILRPEPMISGGTHPLLNFGS